MFCIEQCFLCGKERIDIENRKFRTVRLLAEGGFSMVYLVQELGGRRERFALKKMTCHSERETERARLEIDLHERLSIHPNVLSIETYSIGKTGDSRAMAYQSGHRVIEATQVAIVLPFFKRGTIQDEMDRRRPQGDFIPEERVLRLFHGICDGVRAFHKLLPQAFVHRDLKPANVLLSEDDIPVLMDLGSAAVAKQQIDTNTDAQTLQDDAAELCSMLYRAPELFSVQTGTTFDERVDIWSLGCLLFALCFLRSPFESAHQRGDSVALAVMSGNIGIPDIPTRSSGKRRKQPSALPQETKRSPPKQLPPKSTTGLTPKKLDGRPKPPPPAKLPSKLVIQKSKRKPEERKTPPPPPKPKVKKSEKVDNVAPPSPSKPRVEKQEEKQKCSARVSLYRSIVGDGPKPPPTASQGRIRVDLQSWYYGLVSRKAAEKILSHDGDWMIRGCLSGGTKLDQVLTVMWEGKPKHYLMLNESKGCKLKGSNTPNFATLTDMLRFYELTSITKDGTKLVRAVARPSSYILCSWVSKQADLGQGMMGQTQRALLKKPKETPAQVAHKVLKYDLEHQQRFDLLKRVGEFMQFSHPNIVQYYGVSADRGPPGVVMELCARGSLLNHLRSCNSGFSISVKLSFCHQVAEAMVYLSVTQRVVHGNLSARNCMMAANDAVKVSDYGILNGLDYGNDPKKLYDKLPVKWMAPEVLKLPPEFSTHGDVWSFAVLVWEIWTDGSEPFPQIENEQCVKLIRSGAVQLILPEDMPLELNNMVRACWRPEPHRRPQFTRMALYLDIAAPSRTQESSTK